MVSLQNITMKLQLRNRHFLRGGCGAKLFKKDQTIKFELTAEMLRLGILLYLHGKL
jgi:hypothetical protein